MPFLGIFRSKEKKLNDALVDLYGRVGMASLRSNASLKIALREKWNKGAMDASVEYAVRREFYCFYAHILDYFSFDVLGDHGRVLVTDSIVPLGIVPLVHRSLPGAGDEVWEPVIADFLEYFNIVQFKYALSKVVFVSNLDEILRGGGVPVNDALSDEPEAKVSRLIQSINHILENDLSAFGLKSDLGCVDISPQPDESGGEMKEAKVSGVQLLKPGEDPAIVLYFVDEAFDQMTLPV